MTVDFYMELEDLFQKHGIRDAVISVAMDDEGETVYRTGVRMHEQTGTHDMLKVLAKFRYSILDTIDDTAKKVMEMGVGTRAKDVAACAEGTPEEIAEQNAVNAYIRGYDA